jgi:hemolysin activation/secretion protein
MRKYWLFVTWFVANAVYAATGIDAGSLFQQIEHDRHAPVQQAETSGIVPLEAPVRDNEQDKSLRFTVQKIALLNVSVFDDVSLLALLSDIQGQDISLAELKERIKRITEYYHAHGYPAAYAYLPEQTIAENGVVEVRVLEGYLGQIRLHNQSRLTDAAARERLPKLRVGDPLEQASLERGLWLENDIPGVIAQGALNPGSDPGFTDIDITLNDRPMLSGRLSADNQGNRYTGDGNRFSLQPVLSNITGYGDKLSANLMDGGFGMKYKQLEYQLPTYWTGDGRVGVDYSEINYHVGREFIASGSQGVTRANELYGNYPILRSDAVNFSVEFRHQNKKIRDQIASTNDINQRNSYSQTLNFTGDWRDSAINQWGMIYTAGELHIDNQKHLLLDAASARSLGNYSKYNWNYSREKGVTWLKNATAVFYIGGQITPGRNLDSSEKMVLGGRMGVRAYPSSEGMSDHAIYTTLMLKQQLNEKLLVSISYDYGKGLLNKSPWQAVAKTNKIELGGVSAGVRIEFYKNSYVSILSAWRMTHIKPASGGDTPKGRLWVEMGWSF